MFLRIIQTQNRFALLLEMLYSCKRIAGLAAFGSDRLFFSAAACHGVMAIVLLLMNHMGFGLPFAAYGAASWHAHEMLFGFAAGVAGGFLLTAVPNWTGVPPVPGGLLLGIFLLWLAGRLAFLAADGIGTFNMAIVDGLFLPAIMLVLLKAILQTRKWRDLKVIGPFAILSLANLLFHSGAEALAVRLAVSVYILLVTIIGGRLLPSDTRNAMRRMGRADLPAPHGPFDTLALACGLLALACWTLAPQATGTAITALMAAGMNMLRLFRWRGWALWPSPLPVMLHVSFSFIPLGFAAIACAAQGWVDTQAALHVFTIGAMGCMMFTTMQRMRLKQSGRPLQTGARMVAAWLALIAATPLRFLASLPGGMQGFLLTGSGMLWCLAFSMLAVEAISLSRKRQERG